MSNKKIDIVPLGLCKTTMPKVFLTYLNGFGQMMKMWVGFFYLRGPEENILIDTSMEASLLRVFHPFPTDHIQTFPEALANINLKPADIDKIFMTHMHFDHIGHIRECKNAKVYVREEELEYAKDPHPTIKQFYSGKQLWEDLNFETFSQEEFDICPGAKAFLTPGHTPYGMSVEVDTTKGNAVITGFCTISEAFEDKNIYAPGIHTDFKKAYDNVAEVKKRADIIVPPHEPSLENKESIPS